MNIRKLQQFKWEGHEESCHYDESSCTESSAYWLNVLILIILLNIRKLIQFSSAYCFSLLGLINLSFLSHTSLLLIASASLWFIILSLLDHTFRKLTAISLLEPIRLESLLVCILLSAYCLSLRKKWFIILFLLPHTWGSSSTESATWGLINLSFLSQYLLFCLLPQLPYIHHLVTSSSYQKRRSAYCFSLLEPINLSLLDSYLLFCLLPQPWYSSSCHFSSYLLFCWLL